MAESTAELELFKYDEVADASQVFSFEQALNDNWDKIDAFAGAIKSLSNLDAEGEKRFEDIWTELDKKLEAEVLLSENGYIKFNNSIIIQYCYSPTKKTITLPTSFSTKIYTCVGTICKNKASSPSSGNAAGCISTHSYTKTGFYAIVTSSNGNTFADSGCFIVIGY